MYQVASVQRGKKSIVFIKQFLWHYTTLDRLLEHMHVTKVLEELPYLCYNTLVLDNHWLVQCFSGIVRVHYTLVVVAPGQ